jgi:hypothetical protein
MAKIKQSILEGISGKLGPIVVVNNGTSTYIRTAPTYTEESWSEKQGQLRSRFREVSQFVQRYKKSMIWQIWKLAPGKGGGYHKFLGANLKAFDLDGTVKEWSLVRFSEGVLPAPFQIEAERQPGQIHMTWKNESGLPRVRFSDRLWYMAVANEKFTGPFQTEITRGAMEGFLPDQDDSITGIYVFFAASDEKSFSPDRFVKVE